MEECAAYCEGQVGPILVTALEQQGIAAADIKKLQEGGFNTVESIAFTTKKTLIGVKGISEAKADKIMAAATQLVPMGFASANDYNQLRKKK